MNLIQKLFSPKFSGTADDIDCFNKLLSCYEQVYEMYLNCGCDAVLTIIKLQNRGCSPHLADYYTELAVDIHNSVLQSPEALDLQLLKKKLQQKGLNTALIMEMIQSSGAKLKSKLNTMEQTQAPSNEENKTE